MQIYRIYNKLCNYITIYYLNELVLDSYIKNFHTCLSFAKLSSEKLILLVWPGTGYWSFSKSSRRAKFFFNPQTPESPICVGCRSNGQLSMAPWRGMRVRHWWQTVWPQTNSRGTLSPWKRKTSLQTLHSKIV